MEGEGHESLFKITQLILSPLGKETAYIIFTF